MRKLRIVTDWLIDDGSIPSRIGVNSTGSKTEEEEDHSEEVSVCQSPISVNSHLQCRASSIDLSLPIAEMQESGFTEDNIKSQKYVVLFPSSFFSFNDIQLQGFFSNYRTLFLIMREMIQTERDYVRSLEYIIEVGMFRFLTRFPIDYLSETSSSTNVFFDKIFPVELYSRIVARGYTSSVAW